MEIYQRKCEKIHGQFCFLCSCWHWKISKNTDIFLQAWADYLSICLQCACDRKTIESHLNYLPINGNKNSVNFLAVWNSIWSLHHVLYGRSNLLEVLQRKANWEWRLQDVHYGKKSTGSNSSLWIISICCAPFPLWYS